MCRVMEFQRKRASYIPQENLLTFSGCEEKHKTAEDYPMDSVRHGLGVQREILAQATG